MNFYVESAGRWSGGGTAFLNNARLAAERHAILRGEPGRAIPLIPRNVPSRGTTPKGPHVIAPQNAWPWTPITSGPRETLRAGALRVASDVAIRRASAILRISGVIPTPHRTPASPVIHNVLDLGFEEAIAAARHTQSPWPGHIVSIGSLHSYRNIPQLISGYERYRESGGKAPILIAGPPGSPAAVKAARSAATAVKGVTLMVTSLPRDICLAAMRESAAVVLPSRVEASPLTTLEACAVTPRVVVSDIPANVEILQDYVPTPETAGAFVDPLSPQQFANGISDAEQGGGGAAWHEQLASPKVRSAARDRWGNRLATWLYELASGSHSHQGIAP